MYLCAHGPGYLHRKSSDAAGRAIDQNALPRLDAGVVTQRLERGLRGERNGGSHVELDGRGCERELLAVDRCELRVRAPGEVVDHAEHSVAFGEVGADPCLDLDAVAGRVDLLLADSVALNDGFLTTENGQDWGRLGRAPGICPKRLQ